MDNIYLKFDFHNSNSKPLHTYFVDDLIKCEIDKTHYNYYCINEVINLNLGYCFFEIGGIYYFNINLNNIDNKFISNNLLKNDNLEEYLLQKKRDYKLNNLLDE